MAEKNTDAHVTRRLWGKGNHLAALLGLHGGLHQTVVQVIMLLWFLIS